MKHGLHDLYSFFFFFWNWKRCNISRTLIGPQKEYTVYEFVVQIQLN